jgi:hypothetical protein
MMTTKRVVVGQLEFVAFKITPGEEANQGGFIT